MFEVPLLTIPRSRTNKENLVLLTVMAIRQPLIAVFIAEVLSVVITYRSLRCNISDLDLGYVPTPQFSYAAFWFPVLVHHTTGQFLRGYPGATVQTPIILKRVIILAFCDMLVLIIRSYERQLWASRRVAPVATIKVHKLFHCGVCR